MVQPLATLLCFAFLAVVAPATAAAATAVEGGTAGSALTRSADERAAAVDGETPTDATGWLLQTAAAAASPTLDLRRPRLLGTAVPEVPHPAATGRRDAQPFCSLPDLQLVQLTKDRGS